MTTAISNGTLTMTRLKIGETVSGELLSVDPAGSKYGPTFNLRMSDGSVVRVLPAGNVKRFFIKDITEGKRRTGETVTFTRVADYVSERTGFSSSQFKISNPQPRSTTNDQANRTTTPSDNSSRRSRVLNALNKNEG